MPELTAQELAERLQIGATTLKRWAKEQSWPFREEENSRSRHPRRWYDLDQLPGEIRDKVQKPDTSPVVIDALAFNSSQAERWTRAPEHRRQKAMTCFRAVELFWHHRDAGKTMEEANALARSEVGVSRKTLSCWVRATRGAPKNEWPALLLPKHCNNSAPAEIHHAAWNYLLSDYLRLEQPGFAACYRRLQAAAGQHKDWGAIPSLGSLRKRLHREVSQSTLDIRRGGTEEFADHLPKQRRSKGHLQALEIVNADGHILDVFCRWEDGHESRPVLVAWQDIYSGKLLSWELGETENSTLIRLSFAKMVHEFGIPDAVRLDNGRAFMSKEMTSGSLRNRWRKAFDECEGIYKSFGVDARPTLPYSGRSKPIERYFKDLVEEVARSPECAGAYTGPNPMKKPANHGSRAVPYAELRELIARKVEEMNARTGREAETCAGRSFDETFHESFAARKLVRTVTQDQLQWLMLPARQVKVQKREAVVSLGKRRYFAPELLEFRGHPVSVHYNPSDPGAGCWVFLPGSRKLICKAQCIHDVHFDDSAAAKVTMRERKALQRAFGAQAKQVGTLSPQELVASAQGQQPKPKRHKRPKVVGIDFNKKSAFTPLEEMPPEKQAKILELEKRIRTDPSVWEAMAGLK